MYLQEKRRLRVVYNIGDEVQIRLTGVISKLEGEYEDGKIRIWVKGFTHCTHAVGLEEHIYSPKYNCHSCGREFKEDELFDLPLPDGPDDSGLVPACKECYDRALTHNPE